MNLAAIKSLIEQHEGRRATIYTDTQGHPTVGIGCNLDADSAGIDLTAVAADLKDVLAGTPLTESQIDGLLLIQLNRCIYQAQILFPKLDEMPANAQAVIVDMIFNIGMRGFGLFLKAVLALKQGRWNDAADELKESKWYTQVNPKGYPEDTVGNRGTDNVRMIRELA